jgi:predicted SprT family Zn-dependent metalloprotease
MNVRIKENSRWAKWAARKLNAKSVAITFGNTIHLFNASREDFLKNLPWVRHEVAHVLQYQRYGYIRFLAIYLWESMRRGYYNNRLEQEARNAESDFNLLDNITLL